MNKQTPTVRKESQKGQALIPVLIIMLIVLILGAGSLYLSIGSLLLGTYSQEGEKVLGATEGALENGLLRILRNPNYAGESLQIDGFPCTITVSESSLTVITAECQSERVLRCLEAEVGFVQGEMVVSSYQEK